MSTSLPGVTTIGSLPFVAGERFGDKPAQRFKRDGAWQTLSHAEVAGIVDELARGLIALGVETGARVAILAETRPEWMQTAYAVAAAGAVVVPIYASNSPHECAWILKDSGAVAVVCENAEQVATIESVRGELPELRHVITMDPGAGESDLGVLSERGRETDASTREARTDAVAESDPAIIIYTSGTTGRPKGCVLTHRNLVSCARQAVDLDLIFDDDVAYLFLPLAHVFAQTTNVATTAIGCEIAYVSGGPTSILPDLAEVQPTYFPSVPRIFEKVHAAFTGAPHVEEVFAKVRGAFGGRVRIAITGAAPIAPEILEFFHAAGVPIYEGYGLSESTSYATVNTPAALRLGSVGPRMPFCEVRIEEGEILLRGPNIFAGYWNNPEATAQTLDDEGWLLTGDLGLIDEDGFVFITGRKKEIIITSGGKNITPSEIENDLRRCPFVSYAVMHGDRRPYPVALVTLDAEYCVPWAQSKGLPTDLASIARLDEVRDAIQAVLDEVNSRYAKVEQVKRFAILDHDFSQETGELTPTLKMKRQVINTMYADVLDSLYV